MGVGLAWVETGLKLGPVGLRLGLTLGVKLSWVRLDWAGVRFGVDVELGQLSWVGLSSFSSVSRNCAW